MAKGPKLGLSGQGSGVNASGLQGAVHSPEKFCRSPTHGSEGSDNTKENRPRRGKAGREARGCKIY